MAGMRRWRWQQTTLGEHVAEFLGTMIIILLGNGVVAMAVAALNQSDRGANDLRRPAGDWLLIAWGWGFAVCFARLRRGRRQRRPPEPGGDARDGLAARLRVEPRCRPTSSRRCSARSSAPRSSTSTTATRSARSRRPTRSPAASTDSVPTFSIFAHLPGAATSSSWTGPFVDQMIGTALLVALIFAVTDEYNTPVHANLAPLIIGFIVVAIGISFGANAGYAINPARDFGPRLFAWLAGWKEVAMPGNYGNVNTYFWIPILGPIVGAGIGAAIYDGLIRNVLIARGEKPDPEVDEQGRRRSTRRRHNG